MSVSVVEGGDGPGVAQARGSRTLVAGILGWLAIMAALWPLAPSFADEVGYIGEARVVLAGRFRPTAGDIGVWQPGARGAVDKYPLFPSLLMVPLWLAAPRAVFALGIAAAVCVCLLAARVLRSWGDDPIWALVVLAHPTVVIIARTATADVPLCALMLAAWWALRRDRFRAAPLLIAAVFAIKATGFLIGGALAAGEILRRLPALRQGDADARRGLVSAVTGVVLGVALVAIMNFLTTGGPWFGYNHEAIGARPFWLSHFPRTAPEQLRTVLLLPPLLLLGALPFWRAREPAPLLVIAGFGTLMCFYFFVDSGTNWVETWVLAPRLLLPVVVFLLIGYAHLLAGLARRLRSQSLLHGGLIAATLALTLGLSLRHHRWQVPIARAVDDAQRVSAEAGARELAVSPQAIKAGVLFPGPVRVVEPDQATEPVLLCNDRSASYRARDRDGGFSCLVPGYRSARREGDFEVLVRADARR